MSHGSGNSALSQRDLGVVWHPCTQMRDHEHLPMIPIRRGSGVWLEDHGGRRYLDAISSWWVNLFGHCNAHINARLAAQLDRLEQSMGLNPSARSRLSVQPPAVVAADAKSRFFDGLN